MLRPGPGEGATNASPHGKVRAQSPVDIVTEGSKAANASTTATPPGGLNDQAACDGIFSPALSSAFAILPTLARGNSSTTITSCGTLKPASCSLQATVT